VPPPMMPAFDLVDEVWVASDFTAEALRAASDTPVRTMPIPVPCPDRSAATRADLGLPEGRFVFLVTFDHLSVTERKNPLGAIEAFRRAFPESNPDGPVLVVKSINASHRPAEHDWVLQAAAGRDDVIVVDRHLSRGDQMSLVAESDCVVSLHRTEGLGLHLVEAMWFGRPTIATRYSGNLAFMSDDNSALIDAALVPVTHGEGYFPPEAVWAEPDLDQAASWMQRIVGDPELAARLGSAGRTTMEAQPNMQDTGQAIAAHAAEVPIASADDAAGTAGIAVKRSLVDKARGRAGWLLRGGANERQALDEHAAALRDLQVVVAGLEQRIQQLEGAPRTTDGALDVAEIGRRVTQLSDVVAALSIDRRDDEDRDRER